ncbi:TPA: phage tail protein [Enterobacter hormaechei]|uniref:phage tail fiber protein n=1 Tax=Enterobacter cloacae complex TaxID=354276 RepID=UPI000F826FE8|nr:phage tail protein [Enterobacter hormaechei]EKT9341029.1 phage tail protein [Enterobacter hormaechei]EKT9368409.1 phage tail protein [Enterobacter hormaechei]EKW5511062.1 phage tail protein [Enterobacter hormaechei]ELX9506472.1 phage tail protein [Enterobacter hormaechei]EMD5671640.1 phage tail protein [Enterobacter hormaechei]
MIYTTGTIAISGNTLTGTGTNFTAAGSLIRNGCTVIAMTSPVQVFQITTIGSATSLTVTPAANPTVPAGTRFAILLSDSLSVDGLAQDIAETFTMYQRYMSGFADVMQSAGTVTITINGKVVTVPGMQSVVQKDSNGLVPMTLGGTGASTAAGARKNLELGDAATRNSLYAPDYASEGLMARGYFGWGTYIAHPGGNDGRYNEYSGIYRGPGDGGVQYFDNFAPMLVMSRYQGVYGMLQIAPTTGRAAVRGRSGNNFSAWNELYTTGNTTKASDGTLKAASPVARIVKSQKECQRTDIDEQEFAWCGCGTANAEAEGITISRLDIGVYKLTGSAGLASEGWQLLPPMDPAGMGELGIVEAEQTDSGGLTIRLFKRKYILSEEGEIVKTKGAPIDVPANSWIDVRLDMPEDSIWKTKVLEASIAGADSTPE